MDIRRANFSFVEFENSMLITNDIGHYCFMESEDFEAFLSGDIPQRIIEKYSLDEKGFVYDSEEKYIATYSSYYNMHKSCLLVGTQLLILVLTNKCNQRCVYCQAGEASAEDMSIDTCRKAVDMAVQIPVSHMTIEFQGGEPTYNQKVLEFAIPYAKQKFTEAGKHVEFAIVTNFTEMHEGLMEWLISEDVHVSTSLDGNRLIHEANRPLASHASSYDAWKSGAKKYHYLSTKHNKNRSISAIQTTTRISLHYPKEIVDEYLMNGMTRLYIRPLTPLGCAKDRWETIGYTPEEYIDFYRHVIDYMIELCKSGTFVVELTASTYLTRIMNGESVGHTEFRSPCGAGVGQIAVNYDGSVYTCDEGRMMANMGDDIFKIGTVDSSYKELMESPVVHAVCTASCVEGLPFCADCAFMPFCAVCPVVNYGTEGDLISHEESGYHCMIAKGILSYLFSLLHKNDPSIREIFSKWACE